MTAIGTDDPTKSPRVVNSNRCQTCPSIPGAGLGEVKEAD
jgi:hypothetical protein